MTAMTTTLPRRAFLGGAAAAALGVAGAPGMLGALPAAPAADDRWLDRLTGKYRMLYDTPDFAGGVPPVHMMNYLNTYNSAYNVPDSEINVVGTFYGNTTLLAANDAMWARYRLGEMLGVNDPSGAPWTRNPWRTEVHALGMTIAPASIEALQRRGTLFIACNNALAFFIGAIAGARNADRAAVDADIRANLLPGVVVVPAMVIAIQQAQGRGLAYKRE